MQICRRTLGTSCLSKSLAAIRLAPEEDVELDGKLDDPVWQRVPFSSDFVQKEPDEGTLPTERSEVAFVYDAGALFVGARMFSEEPEAIRAITTRRDDGANSERLIVSLDTYQNRRTTVAFAVTAAGVRLDWLTYDDAEWRRDWSFDPVWEADARLDSLGWTAEMRIPFSQLRFNKADSLVWGLNVNRYIPQKNEDIFWIPVPRDESGWASWFGDLQGLQAIRARRPIELVPYVATSATLTSSELVNPADPFRSESELDGRVGADLKAGIGPSLTLDATFNPDFGQVEADPAEVNLSVFPTFFSERRPFFIEGRELLEAHGLFYSRRIGAPPTGFAAGDFVDSPLNTTILAAGELTGRSPAGLSLGALVGVTDNEYAVVADTGAGTTQKVRVEPLTAWGVVRATQEFGAAASTAGLALTGVRRDVGGLDPLAAQIHRQAYSGGGDFNLRLQGGTYEVEGRLAGSYIEGDSLAIDRVQRFSSHFFQRPDADHLSYDPSRTSLSGYSASLGIERTSAVHWLWEAWAEAVSPGFDINDAGRLRRADRLETGGSLTYRETQPGVFHRYSLSTWFGAGWNYGWDRQFGYLGGEAGVTLRSFWGLHLGAEVYPRSQNDFLTRGGPSMGEGLGWSIWGNFNTDFRKKTVFSAYGNYAKDELGGWSYSVFLDLELLPGGAWQISLEPSYRRRRDPRQYVGTFDGGSEATFGSRYVFGFIDRSTIATELRLAYAFNPDLSLELYAEPFAETGRYFDYGELEAARSRDLRMYGTDGTTISEEESEEPEAANVITVTDGEDEFSFIRGDFSALSFRTNLVLRWEWRLGSTLFLVWQLDRGSFDFMADPEPAGPRNLWDGPSAPGQSFFAIKASYWLPI
jgi:hypothetical protein